MFTSCRISVSENLEYIIMTHKGYINKNLGAAYRSEARSLAKKYGIKRYLIDLRQARNSDTFIDKYEYIHCDLKNIPESCKNDTLALVVAPEDHSHDFIEHLSRKSGCNTRIFRSMPKAVEYLTSCDSCQGNGSDVQEKEFLSLYPRYSKPQKDIEYLCPLCGCRDFNYDGKKSPNPIICANCGISYSEKELRDINRENLSFVFDLTNDESVEELQSPLPEKPEVLQPNDYPA